MPTPTPRLQGQSAFAEECEQLYAADQHEKLLDKFVSALDVVLAASTSDQGASGGSGGARLIAAAAAACLPACSVTRARQQSDAPAATCPADLECCLNLTCHLVPRIPLPAAVAAAARLAAALAATTDSRPEKRLLALVTLYNAAYDSGSKAAVLMEALGYAKRAGLSDIMLPVIRAHADGWAGELQLGAGAERQLYTACADTLGACTRKPRTAAREAYRLLSKCLATYEVGAGWWVGAPLTKILRQRGRHRHPALSVNVGVPSSTAQHGVSSSSSSSSTLERHCALPAASDPRSLPAAAAGRARGGAARRSAGGGAGCR
jgi:hypothetical protein